jgi:hypothetical protein
VERLLRQRLGRYGRRSGRESRARDHRCAGLGELFLGEFLAKGADISRHLTRAELDTMCDPAGYFGLAGETVDRVLARKAR